MTKVGYIEVYDQHLTSAPPALDSPQGAIGATITIAHVRSQGRTFVYDIRITKGTFYARLFQIRCNGEARGSAFDGTTDGWKQCLREVCQSASLHLTLLPPL